MEYGEFNLSMFSGNRNHRQGLHGSRRSVCLPINVPYLHLVPKDVLPGSTFHDFIWHLSDRGLVNG